MRKGIKIINKIRTQDGKRLFENFLSLSSLQIASYIFPIITLPYLARVLGVEYYGKIAFASTIIVYFQTFVDYGFIYSSVRDISLCRDDKEKVSIIFSTTMYARLFLSLISFLILIILIFMVPYFYDMSKILICTYLIVPGHAIFAEWLFQGIEKMKYITIFNLLMKAAFTISIFIFVKQQSDYYLQPLLSALGYISVGLLSLVVIYMNNIKFVKVPFKQIFNCIRKNTDLFINQLFPNLYNSLSTLFLGLMHGNAANGIFDAGYKFSGTCQQFFYIISRTFFPYLARKTDSHTLYAKVNLIMAVIVSFLLLLSAPLIIRIFFTSDFYDGIYVLQILSFSIFFLVVSNVYGTNYLIIKGYEKELRKATMYASIISFFVALPLVYFLSYIGVAIVITFARGLIALFTYIQYRKIGKIERIDNI